MTSQLGDLTYPAKKSCRKLRKGCPISYAKFQRDLPSGLAAISEKNHGGWHQFPCTARIKYFQRFQIFENNISQISEIKLPVQVYYMSVNDTGTIQSLCGRFLVTRWHPNCSAPFQPLGALFIAQCTPCNYSNSQVAANLQQSSTTLQSTDDTEKQQVVAPLLWLGAPEVEHPQRFFKNITPLRVLTTCFMRIAVAVYLFCYHSALLVWDLCQHCKYADQKSLVTTRTINQRVILVATIQHQTA